MQFERIAAYGPHYVEQDCELLVNLFYDSTSFSNDGQSLTSAPIFVVDDDVIIIIIIADHFSSAGIEQSVGCVCVCACRCLENDFRRK